MAEKLGVSQTDLAYAWVLRNPYVGTALTGASRPEQVYESVMALDAVKLLTDEAMGEIEQILHNRAVEAVRKTCIDMDSSDELPRADRVVWIH